jgi:putative membrane protein
MPAPIRFHQGLPLAPHDLWSAWSLEPGVLLGVSLAFVLYWRGTQALRRRSCRGIQVRGWRGLAFAGGIGAVIIALISPLDALGAALGSVHMAQHTLLALVAAPLLVLAAPLAAMAWGLPKRLRCASAFQTVMRTLRTVGGVLSRLPVALALHIMALWLWHLPGPYGAALAHEPVHITQHLTLFGTALLFWSATGLASIRRRNGAAVLALFVMMLQSSVLSALLLIARRPWYLGYAETTQVWGLTLLQDQQIAALVMMVLCDLIYLAAALGLLAAWLQIGEGRGMADLPASIREGRVHP